MAAPEQPPDPIGTAPDAAAIVPTTLDGLPPVFPRLLDHAVLTAAIGLDDPFELTGATYAPPIGTKAIDDSGAPPNRIHLYRRPILEERVDTGVRQEDLVAHVVIHEVGHHCGLSDADMHRPEEGA